jgi:hypothetical protein
MVKKRARLEDNDPLSSTDRVLAGFEQLSKSAIQEPDKLTSQQDSNITSQQPMMEQITINGETASQQSDKLTSQQDSNITSQQPMMEQITINREITSQQSDKSAIQQDSNTTSQQPMMEQITINREITSQQSDKSAIQQVDNIEKPKLRKSTFQISETVLLQLDQVHLRLQLELGKAIAPYKEVIVEEALVRLLEQFADDRSGLIEVLVSRQKSRDKP